MEERIGIAAEDIKKGETVVMEGMKLRPARNKNTNNLWILGVEVGKVAICIQPEGAKAQLYGFIDKIYGLNSMKIVHGHIEVIPTRESIELYRSVIAGQEIP